MLNHPLLPPCRRAASQQPVLGAAAAAAAARHRGLEWLSKGVSQHCICSLYCGRGSCIYSIYSFNSSCDRGTYSLYSIHCNRCSCIRSIHSIYCGRGSRIYSIYSIHFIRFRHRRILRRILCLPDLLLACNAGMRGYPVILDRAGRRLLAQRPDEGGDLGRGAEGQQEIILQVRRGVVGHMVAAGGEGWGLAQ